LPLYSWYPGQHFLVADGPDSFADQVVRFLQDPQLRETFSLAGRLPLAEAHSWPNSMRILDELLENRNASVEKQFESK